MEQSNSVRLGLHAYAAFAACQEPWECARYLFSPKFLTHRQDNSFIFNHHSGISGRLAWEHSD